MTVADKVKQLREQLKMSQAELAHKMGLKSRSSITRIEKSGDNITLKDVERLSKALGCSPLYLMGWDNHSEKPLSKEDAQFILLYRQLSDEQKKLVDNMLTVFSSKQ